MYYEDKYIINEKNNLFYGSDLIDWKYYDWDE